MCWAQVEMNVESFSTIDFSVDQDHDPILWFAKKMHDKPREAFDANSLNCLDNKKRSVINISFLR